MMREIIKNMHGVFTGYNAGYVDDVLSDMRYAGAANDKKNIRQDAVNLFTDIDKAIREAKIRLINQSNGKKAAEHTSNCEQVSGSY
jgi:hypothetical protein